MEDEEVTLFIPHGYGKGTVIRDIDGNPWLVGDTVVSPIHKVSRIEEEVAVKLIEQGASLIVATKKD